MNTPRTRRAARALFAHVLAGVSRDGGADGRGAPSPRVTSWHTARSPGGWNVCRFFFWCPDRWAASADRCLCSLQQTLAMRRGTCQVHSRRRPQHHPRSKPRRAARHRARVGRVCSETRAAAVVSKTSSRHRRANRLREREEREAVAVVPQHLAAAAALRPRPPTALAARRTTTRKS